MERHVCPPWRIYPRRDDGDARHRGSRRERARLSTRVLVPLSCGEDALNRAVTLITDSETQRAARRTGSVVTRQVLAVLTSSWAMSGLAGSAMPVPHPILAPSRPHIRFCVFTCSPFASLGQTAGARVARLTPTWTWTRESRGGPGRGTARGVPGSAQRRGLALARKRSGRTGLSLYLRSRWPTHEWAGCGRSILGSTRDQQRTMRCVTDRQTDRLAAGMRTGRGGGSGSFLQITMIPKLCLPWPLFPLLLMSTYNALLTPYRCRLFTHNAILELVLERGTTLPSLHYTHDVPYSRHHELRPEYLEDYHCTRSPRKSRNAPLSSGVSGRTTLSTPLTPTETGSFAPGPPRSTRHAMSGNARKRRQ